MTEKKKDDLEVHTVRTSKLCVSLRMTGVTVTGIDDVIDF